MKRIIIITVSWVILIFPVSAFSSVGVWDYSMWDETLWSNTQSVPIFTNSVGPRNSIKVTDMSGTLPSAGGTISVSAWDTNGTSIPESGSEVVGIVWTGNRGL